ncbi:hypothetical protein ACHAXT_011814 [Thalassiosira profunda]
MAVAFGGSVVEEEGGRHARARGHRAPLQPPEPELQHRRFALEVAELPPLLRRKRFRQREAHLVVPAWEGTVLGRGQGERVQGQCRFVRGGGGRIALEANASFGLCVRKDGNGYFTPVCEMANLTRRNGPRGVCVVAVAPFCTATSSNAEITPSSSSWSVTRSTGLESATFQSSAAGAGRGCSFAASFIPADCKSLAPTAASASSSSSPAPPYTSVAIRRSTGSDASVTFENTSSHCLSTMPSQNPPFRTSFLSTIDSRSVSTLCSSNPDADALLAPFFVPCPAGGTPIIDSSSKYRATSPSTGNWSSSASGRKPRSRISRDLRCSSRPYASRHALEVVR